jgi:hypothetical protein
MNTLFVTFCGSLVLLLLYFRDVFFVNVFKIYNKYIGKNMNIYNTKEV